MCIRDSLTIADYYNEGLLNPDVSIANTNANIVSLYGFPPGTTIDLAAGEITLGVNTPGNFLGTIVAENGPLAVSVELLLEVIGGDTTAPVLTNGGTSDVAVQASGGVVPSTSIFTDASAITYSSEAAGGAALNTLAAGNITYNSAARTWTVASGTGPGDYDVQETATDASGNATSHIHRISVLAGTASTSFSLDAISGDDVVWFRETPVSLLVSGSTGFTPTGNSAVLTGPYGSVAINVTYINPNNATLELPVALIGHICFFGDTLSLSVSNGNGEVDARSFVLSENPADLPGIVTVTDVSNGGVWEGQGLSVGDEVYIEDVGGNSYNAGASDWGAGNPAFTAAQLPASFRWWGRTAAGDPIFNPAASAGGFFINVAANSSPTWITPPADQSLTEDLPFSVTIAGSAYSDPDVGDVLSLQVTQEDGSSLPSWLAFDGAATISSTGPTQADTIAGPVNLRFRISDQDGAFDLSLIHI